MSDPLKQHDALLRQHQFELVRQGKHFIYRNPEGKVYVTSATPSDSRWAKTALTTLKRVIDSPPVPMTLAISEFDREQAANLLAGDSKQRGPGHGKQKHSGGTGIGYIDKPVKEIASTRTLEEKQHEKAQHQWESRVREERRQFIEDIIRKAKPLIAKINQDNERRRQLTVDQFKYYAETRLRKDVETFVRLRNRCKCPDDDCTCGKIRIANYRVSPLFHVLACHDSLSALSDHEMDEVENCKACLEDGDGYLMCPAHWFKSLHNVAVNPEKIIPPVEAITLNMFVKDAKEIFQFAMRNPGEFSKLWKHRMGLNNDVLTRYGLKKLKPIIEELLRTRPGSGAEDQSAWAPGRGRPDVYD